MQPFLKVVGFLIVIVIAVGLILPNSVNVRRSIEIDAAVSSIHQYTNDLEKWPEWSPWLEQDPTIVTELGDVSQGVGASQTWKGQGGSGAITFTDSSVDKGIAYDMQFDGDQTEYKAGLSYEKKGNKILVTWYMRGEMKPIIIGNYFALLMDGLVGDSFSDGLEKLKILAEKESL